MNSLSKTKESFNLFKFFKKLPQEKPKENNLFAIQKPNTTESHINTITEKTINHLKQKTTQSKEKELQLFETINQLLDNTQYNIFNIQERFHNFINLESYIKNNDKVQLPLLLIMFAAYQSLKTQPSKRLPKITDTKMTKIIMQYSQCENAGHDLVKMLFKVDMLVMRYLFDRTELPYVSDIHMIMVNNALLFLQELGSSIVSREAVQFIDEIAKLITINTKIPPKL